MPQDSTIDRFRSRVLIRLDTLIRLRWWAILGQTVAILITRFVLDYSFPWMVCSLLIAVSAALNFILSQRYKVNHRLPGERVFYLMIFDIMQLGVLLYVTGGLQNPFSILLMAPVTVSATSMRLRHTLFLGVLAAIVSTFLVFYHMPLPWSVTGEFKLPLVYVAGVWVAFICTLAFTAIYAFRVAEEARKLADALAATELVLQREQHLSVLDGLAAAAAHELGTPLATIALVSKEMVNALPQDDVMRDDAQLLRSQAERCREILQKLTSLSSNSEGVLERQSLAILVEEAVAPLREFDIEIDVTHSGDQAQLPHMMRNPAVAYGLGNLIDNAVDFAVKQVSITTSWNSDEVIIDIRDDGPGFPSDMLHRIGEPYVSTRAQTGDPQNHGMGLGLFIAKTLLERSGAELEFSNVLDVNKTKYSASARVMWRREAFERANGSLRADESTEFQSD